MKFFVATALFAALAVSSAEFTGCTRGKFGVYANPTDCSKYVMCVSGAAVSVTCPFGMKFDSRIGTCSPFAKCKPAQVVDEPHHEEPNHEEPHHEEPHHEEPNHEEPHHEEPHHEEPNHEEPHHEEPHHEEPHHEEPHHEEPHHEEPNHEEPHHEEPHHEEPHHEEPHHEEPTEPAKFSCPRASGRFADPENCKHYYSCKNGEAVHYECPFKLNFSSKWSMCLPGVKCIKAEKPQHEEPHHEEPHHEEPHHEEPHHEEPHHEEPHHEEPHHEEPHHEEPHHEEPHHEEPHHEEPHHEEPHHEEPHHEEPHHEEPHHEEPHHEEPHHEEPHHEEPHHEEPVVDSFTCPRTNGRFADVHNCRQFHECRDGQPQLRTCSFKWRFSRTLGMCLPGIKCVEEPVHEEPHHEEPHHEEPHHEEPHHEEPHHEEPHHEEPHHEEPHHEEPHHEEPHHEEPHHEEPHHEEPHHEEPHHEEPHHEEPHHEEPHHEEPHHEEPHHEEPHHEEPHHEEPTIPEKFTCKKSFGLFADSEDCSKYHMCVRGRAFTVTCPTNTKYDFINKHCQAAQARCLKQKDEAIEEKEPVQEEKAFECPVEFGLFPASDCTKFIQCAHGTAHKMACPAGTEWNQEAQACDHITARCAAQ